MIICMRAQMCSDVCMHSVSLQRKRQLEYRIKEAKLQKDKARTDLRLARQREERLMDKAKGLNVAGCDG